MLDWFTSCHSKRTWLRCATNPAFWAGPLTPLLISALISFFFAEVLIILHTQQDHCPKVLLLPAGEPVRILVSSLIVCCIESWSGAGMHSEVSLPSTSGTCLLALQNKRALSQSLGVLWVRASLSQNRGLGLGWPSRVQKTGPRKALRFLT